MGEEKLPKNWISATLGEVAKWSSGGTPKRSNKSYYGGNIPWIKTGDLNNKIVTEANEFLTEAGIKNSSAKLFPKGSVGIAMYGATIGKTALFGIDAATNQACAVAQTYDGVSNEFLHYYLKSEKQNFIDKGKGGAQPNISQTIIKAHPIPRPPLPEQHRIVAKLDALMARVAVLEAGLARIPQLLADFRQSVLSKAVTGELTEEWREGKELGGIVNLFNRISERRLKSSKKKVREISSSVRGDLELFDLPDTWTWTNLRFVMNEDDSFCYGVVQPGDYVDNEQKLVRVLDINAGKIKMEQLRGISWSVDEKYKRSRINPGDLLVSVVGTIGRTAVVPSNCAGFNIARAVAKVPIRDFDTNYVKIFIDSIYGQSWLLGDSREVARKTLNLEQLSTLPVPIPSPEEQAEIVRRVESLFAQADAIEARYEKLKQKVETLPQAILAKAFRGELVPQLPEDGDAGDLLAEIKKLRKK